MKYTKSYIKDRDIKMNIGIVCCYSKFQAVILKLFFSEICTELFNAYVYMFKFFITYTHNDYRS